MNSLYFDCFAGISGDMCLASLINVGMPESHLRSEVAKLGIDDEFKLKVSKSQKNGIHGLRVDVEVSGHSHHKLHGDDKEHHHHDHTQERDYKQIKKLIRQSALQKSVIERAIKIFDEIAIAEAEVHQMSIDTVHFHEVGATDSIVDIVGSAIGFEYLMSEMNVSQVLCSPIELGGGTVNCAHGVYPVPAPATARIITGVPITSGGVIGEATTPTGAAIMKACVDKFVNRIQGTPLNTVYGIGHRDANIPNVVRVQLIKNNNFPNEHSKIEANIDDMSPEAFEPLIERLFEAGASDVFLQPISMKKSRPAQMLSVLCKNETVKNLGEIILNHSSTIGLRIHPFQKMLLPRRIVIVPTTIGDVSAKVVLQPDGHYRFKSEHDEIVKIAQDSGESYLSIKRKIDSEIEAPLSTRKIEDLIE